MKCKLKGAVRKDQNVTPDLKRTPSPSNPPSGQQPP